MSMRWMETWAWRVFAPLLAGLWVTPPMPTPDILLTHGYFLHEDPKEQEIMKPYPMLGLLYISAYLRRCGLGVEIFDSTFETRAHLEERLAVSPGVLGVYTNLMTRPSVVAIAAAAKRHGWVVIAGGPESANYPEEYLDNGVDVVVLGEGEHTLEELLPAIQRGGPHSLEGIAGTVFRNQDGKTVHNLPR